jgi:hypothetical protein
MAKKITKITIIILALITGYNVFAANLNENLAGRILLQVENKGEAWYINPNNLQRYYLGKPLDVLTIFKKLSLGISDSDIKSIPIGVIQSDGLDSDADGLTNYLENTIGTNINKKDTNNNSYDDKTEILNGYDPVNQGKIIFNQNLINRLKGRILLQVKNHGACWYLNPADGKRYFLGRPTDGFNLLKKFGLGITNSNLNKISVAYDSSKATSGNNINNKEENQENSEIKIDNTPYAVIQAVARNLRDGKDENVKQYCLPDWQKAISYGLGVLNSGQKVLLADILAIASPTETSDNEVTFTSQVYWQEKSYPVNFIVRKNEDGIWKLLNI